MTKVLEVIIDAVRQGGIEIDDDGILRDGCGLLMISDDGHSLGIHTLTGHINLAIDHGDPDTTIAEAIRVLQDQVKTRQMLDTLNRNAVMPPDCNQLPDVR